jgi:hypothetical protein
MEAINLHKQMAMGKSYPTSVTTGKDPAPTPGLPKADYKTMPKMKVEKVKGEGNK